MNDEVEDTIGQYFEGLITPEETYHKVALLMNDATLASAYVRERGITLPVTIL